MKKLSLHSLFAVSIALSGVVASAGSASAKDTNSATATFSATVANICEVSSTGQGVLTHNPAGGSLTTTQSASVSVSCTGPATISLSQLNTNEIEYRGASVTATNGSLAAKLTDTVKPTTDIEDIPEEELKEKYGSAYDAAQEPIPATSGTPGFEGTFEDYLAGEGIEIPPADPVAPIPLDQQLPGKFFEYQAAQAGTPGTPEIPGFSGSFEEYLEKEGIDTTREVEVPALSGESATTNGPIDTSFKVSMDLNGVGTTENGTYQTTVVVTAAPN